MAEIKVKGNTNDLLYVNDEEGVMSVKSTRFIKLPDDMNVYKSEVFDVALTSSSGSGEHPLFDKLLGKELEIIIRYQDEDE